jgi:hypothetical protein
MDEINRALKRATILVLFVSPASLKSQVVKMEYRYALLAGTPVIPVICRKSKLPPELLGIQYVKVSELNKLLLSNSSTKCRKRFRRTSKSRSSLSVYLNRLLPKKALTKAR